MSSIHENGSVYDEIGGSEDSESNYSDLAEQEITMDVLLPDNSLHKITVTASTPLSDLRATVCSQFKLLPSKHVVEFVGGKSSVTKRKASLAIGRLDATMIKILTKKASSKPSSVPAAVANTNENTVRLIVKLPRLRQSIIRVNPDAALQTIFTSVCDKLNLDDEKRSKVEFHHPVQADTKLSLNLTLNDYNLREVTLAFKKEQSEVAKPPTPGSTHAPKAAARKKKAPAPPRPNAKASHDQTTDSNSDAKQMPTKPTKRRHAPLPPQATQKVVEPEPVYAVIRKKKPDNKVEDKPQSTSEMKTDEESVEKADHSSVENETHLATNEEETIAASLDATEELDKVLDAESLQSNDGDEMDESTPEEAHFPDKPPRIHKTVHKEADEHDDITYHVVMTDDEAPKQQATPPKSKDNEIKIYDVVDDEIKFDDSMETSSNHSDDVKATDDVVGGDAAVVNEAEHMEEKEEVVVPQTEDIAELVPETIPNEVEDKKSSVEVAEEVKVVAEEQPPQEELVISPATYIDPPPPPLDDVDDLPPPPPSFLASDDFDLPPPPQDFSDSTTSQVEKVTITETTSLPTPVADVKPHTEEHTSSNKENSFDLHIAESLGIANVAIEDHNPKSPPPPVKTKPTKAVKPKSLAEFIKDQNENEIKAASHYEPMSKTDEDLAKIQMEIKRMKLRKSAKENERNDQWKKLKEGQRNSWHPGSTSNSFTFVPKKSVEAKTHEDYKEASKPVIGFSSSGEIKKLPNGVSDKTEKKEPPLPTVAETAAKPRSTLPSYYKKFLGANAFSASKTTGR